MRVNLADHRLSVYDIVDTMQAAYAESKDHDKKQVAITTPIVARTMRQLIEQYRQAEKRDPSAELAELRSITMRWGELTIHEEPMVPPGTILFIDERDFPEWKRAMDESKQYVKSSIVGIGSELA